MGYSECHVLETGGAQDALALVRGALGRGAQVTALDLSALSARDAGDQAEMGMLVVPFDKDTDMAAVGSAVARWRAEGGRLSVLGLARSCEQAGRVAPGGVFDTLVSADWAAAPEMLRRFAESHASDQQNRAFKAFLDTSVDGYWIWHMTRDRIEWSRRTSEMMGLAPEQAPDTVAAFLRLVHPEDRGTVEQAVRAHVTGAAPYRDVAMRLRLANGHYGHFIANGQALRDAEGQAIVLVGSLTDTTRVERAERQLESTRRRYAALFQHMNDAAILADAETGIIIEANLPAAALWGKSVADLVGMHQSHLHPERVRPEIRRLFTEHVALLKQGARNTISVPVLRADGGEVPAEISSSLIEIDGRIMVLGVFRDISERVSAEREIRARDAQIQLSSHLAAMGTLAAGVAHEINNPLTYVLGNLELVRRALQEHGITCPDIAGALDDAESGGRYVREIVADLKSIGRIDATEPDCDPAEVIRIATRMAMSDLRHRAQLDMALNDVGRVPLASARLSQVVLNILSNASRAFSSSRRQDNRIAIAATREAGQVRIVIEDNGCGISADDLARVEQPFFTSRGHSGSAGLGLAICRRILSEAGGALQIHSCPGQGTRVTVTLPALAHERPSAKVVPLPQPAHHRPPRPAVVVVDDDALVTSLVERMLEDRFRVTVFNDAQSALEALRGGLKCDVVLSDIMMPEMDGVSFYEQARGMAPFLFLTGGAVTARCIAFERRMLAEGRLMHKPFDTVELQRKLLHIIRTAAAQQPHAPQQKGLVMNECDKSGPDGGPATPAGQPQTAILSELEELLGRDGVRTQFRKLLEQMNGFAAESADMSPEVLAQEAHKMAGAADVMGLRDIGGTLRGCQHAAAEGDIKAARAALDKVRPMQRAFEQFLSAY